MSGVSDRGLYDLLFAGKSGKLHPKQAQQVNEDQAQKKVDEDEKKNIIMKKLGQA